MHSPFWEKPNTIWYFIDCYVLCGVPWRWRFFLAMFALFWWNKTTPSTIQNTIVPPATPLTAWTIEYSPVINIYTYIYEILSIPGKSSVGDVNANQFQRWLGGNVNCKFVIIKDTSKRFKSLKTNFMLCKFYVVRMLHETTKVNETNNEQSHNAIV